METGMRDDQTDLEHERQGQPEQPPRRGGKPAKDHAATQEPLLGNVREKVPAEQQLERGPDENPLSQTVREGGRADAGSGRQRGTDGKS
jgi:hypothetical protein